MKNPMTLAGIEPATFRFVAQHLNHCATAVRLCLIVLFLILSFLEIRAERRQKSISVEFSFATVFAFKRHVSAARLTINYCRNFISFSGAPKFACVPSNGLRLILHERSKRGV